MSLKESRSPSYPQMGLSKCLDLLRRLYEGIHRGAVGNVEAQQIMGFAPRSGSGLAALSALKKFGLVEGRDPQLRITDLGFRVLEPMDPDEYQHGIREAALNSPIFAEMLSDFGGRLPADAVIRAKLIRERGFTSSGVDAFIKSLRETVSLMQSGDSFDIQYPKSVAALPAPEISNALAGSGAGLVGVGARPSAAPEEQGEVLKFRIGPETAVTVAFSGPVTRDSMLKLSRLIEVLSDGYDVI